jgi:gamma-glutamyl phosphate reductase
MNEDDISPAERAKAAKAATQVLKSLSGEQRSAILREMANQIELQRRKILGEMQFFAHA